MADDNLGSDSEEVMLSEGDQSVDLLSQSAEEELDAGVHEEAAMDVPRAAEGDDDAESFASEASEDMQEEAEPAAAAEAPAAEPAAPTPPPPAAAAAEEQPPAASSSAEAPPPQQQQQQQEQQEQQQQQPPKPAGLGLGAGLGGPRGLGGLGLKPPAPKAAEPQQQQQQQPAPKGLGLGGLGLGPKLPAKPAASSSSSSTTANGPAADAAAAAQPAAAQPAAAAAAAAGPPKPAGGVGLLPPKPKAAAAAGSGGDSTSSSSSAPAPAQQQQHPAKPAGGLGSLPARTPAGGVPALGPRPAAAAAGGGGQAGGAPAASGGSAFRPQLGPRPAVAAGGGGAAVVRAPAAAAAGGSAGGVVDPEEAKAMQKMRAKLQELRVDCLRAGMRLGYAATSEQLQQWLGVLERIEKVNAPPLRRRVDVNRLALAEATELNGSTAPDSPLDIHIKLLVVGMTGTGKSELINALLGRPALPTNAFRESTRRIKVVKGRIAGMAVTAIDTPGLHASADAQSANRSLLKGIKAAWKKHKPNFLIYVDRLDATRPSFGEMGLLSNLTATLGQGAWKKAIVVLTHANAAREKLGREYMTVVKQRKNIVTNIIRQAAGEMQLRINLHSVDTHPETPRTPGGEMLVYDQVTPMALTPTPVPWRPALLLNMLGLYAFETGVELIQKAQPKPKAAGGAKQQDMFKQMMRSRLPPTSYFVEQLVEGVTKPEGWAVPEDPFGAETDDEEAEEFKHIYYKIMYNLAAKGDPRAQKEYAAWLRKLDKAKRAYQEAYENEEIEQLAAYGYEGYVTEALDLGPSFDPEDSTDHRYMYPISDTQIAIMPTLDYYGYEHEDAITGFVAEWQGQPWNVDGWGGVPVDITATIEKDKTTTCLQAEANASIVHSVAPFGNRHITQLSGAFELLRPNVKDILYTLEANTFKDGLLGGNDHAGAGLMLTRMAENGNIRKGPVGVGVRIQENMRVGPLKVEAVAAQVRGETPMGGRDEGWAARAFVLHDWIPGLAMNFDWYQERTKDESSTIGGWATALGYDFGTPGGYPAAMEVDWVSGSDVVHVDASLYAPYDWKPAWLLLIPAVNWAKDWWRRWRDSRRGVEEEEEVEIEEEEEGMMGGADLGAMLQGMSGPDAQAMLQQLMQSGGLQQLMGGGGRMG